MSSEQHTAIKAGIFVIVCSMLLVVVIVLLGKRSQLFERHYRLRSQFRNGYGIIPGADVRLAGVKAGSVSKVEIVTVNGESAVRVDLVVAWKYRHKITEDSRASIRMIGALGDKYVEITLGAANSPALKDGESLQSEESDDFYEIVKEAREALKRACDLTDEANAAFKNLNESMVIEDLTTSLKQVNTALKTLNDNQVIQDLAKSVKSARKTAETIEKGPGLLHDLIYDEKLAKAAADVSETSGALRQAIERIQAGKGPLGLLLYSEGMEKAFTDLAETSASAKKILREIERGKGTAHALIYDREELETLREFGTVARRLNGILADVDDATGTLGLVIKDPELWEIMKRVLGGVEESWMLKSIIKQKAAQE